MTDAYLDASALLPRLVREPSSVAMDHFLDKWRDGLIVGEFAAAEVSSAISRLVRTRILDSEAAQECLADFDSWRHDAATGLEVDGADVRLADRFVRRFHLMLRAPDALHVATCFRHGLTLVTLDRRLAAAAQSLGVTARMPVP